MMFYKISCPQCQKFEKLYCCSLYIVILFIASLNCNVLETAKILGNSYCYCRGEKQR